MIKYIYKKLDSEKATIQGTSPSGAGSILTLTDMTDGRPEPEHLLKAVEIINEQLERMEAEG